MKTMAIKGTGEASGMPDKIEIKLTLISEDKIYEKMMTKANVDLERLKKDLTAVGFSDEDFKTTNFNVESVYDNVRNSSGEYIRVFKGFKCVHNLVFEFPYDTDKLAQTLFAISKSLTAPEFSIVFTVKDKTAMTEKLLQNAIADAKSKAEILSKASNVKLGDIQKITYNFDDIAMVSNTRFQPRLAATYDAANISITPEDIKINDTVLVEWEIL
ncbi:MAG: SIMPL domain-containing protein [Clostridia bacterium]